jgi:hypothetical protein
MTQPRFIRVTKEVRLALAECQKLNHAIDECDIEWAPWRSRKTGVPESDGAAAVAALNRLATAIAEMGEVPTMDLSVEHTWTTECVDERLHMNHAEDGKPWSSLMFCSDGDEVEVNLSNWEPPSSLDLPYDYTLTGMSFGQARALRDWLDEWLAARPWTAEEVREVEARAERFSDLFDGPTDTGAP